MKSVDQFQKKKKMKSVDVISEIVNFDSLQNKMMRSKENTKLNRKF